MGRNGIPVIGFGPGAEDQTHAPNETTGNPTLLCVPLYMLLYQLFTLSNNISNYIGKSLTVI